MAQIDVVQGRQVALIDAVDHLLNRGVVVSGHALLSLAGVDLIYLGLSVVITSVETLQQNAEGGGDPSRPSRPAPPSGWGGLLLPRAVGESALDSGRTDVALSSGGTGTALVGTTASTLGSAAGMPAPPNLGTPPALRPDGGPVANAAASDPESAANGLAQLVLTLVELLRQLLERQAVRRMEGTGLSDEEIERMGLALMELEAKMTELREIFGFEAGDLNLDLGPLGRLLDA